MEVSKYNRDVFEKYIADFETHASECISIRDHNTSAIVPLIFNASQKIFFQDKSYIPLFNEGRQKANFRLRADQSDRSLTSGGLEKLL